MTAWHREIRALLNATALWDAVAEKEEAAVCRALPQHQAATGKELLGLTRGHLARRVTEKMADCRFELIAPPDEGPSQFTIHHRPVRLIDAIWQQLAEEIAGLITCEMRAWRGGRQMPIAESGHTEVACDSFCWRRRHRLPVTHGNFDLAPKLDLQYPLQTQRFFALPAECSGAVYGWNLIENQYVPTIGTSPCRP